MTARAGPVSYILLAEFDIDQGSILKHSYPAATGTDEHLLAEHMLPDGAHDRNEDWTIFYLNQIPGLTVDTSLVPLSRSPTSEELDDGTSPAGDESGEQRKEKNKIAEGGRRKDEDEGGLLYVMSLVRTKKVATVRRGALVKALAVASRYPYIQIYKPILLLALEDYFNEPSIACLSRLYSAINSMDLTSLPPLSLDERLVLRTTERKDMFEEKFLDAEVNPSQVISRSTSVLSLSHIVQPSTEEVIENLEADHRSISSAGSVSSITSRGGFSLPIDDNQSWQGAETVGSSDEWLGRRNVNRSSTPSASTGRPKDTHWYDTKIFYSGISLPIRIPLGTFPEEVGDYSLIKLVQIFSNSSALSTTGPYHPHLHTSGSSTHPIILLFNALVSYKRVVFLGHGQAAGQVANLVLSACALGSGCGSVLKGFTDRAFPYTNLTNLDNLETVPGYIAGVCNPAFADRPAWWDVLCNVETGKIVISKDIKLASTSPPAGVATASINPIEDLELAMRSSAGASGMKMPDPKVESPDNLFMDEITGAIQAHYGEAFIRSRFTDYAHRFVRLASRYEEDTLGATTIGFQSSKFTRGSSSGEAKLGSGIFFLDEASKTRELASSIGRIEGWRGTPSYHKYQASFRERVMEQPSSSQTFDILHQLASLRQSRKMSGGEAELLMHTIALQSKTEEGLLAILAQLPPHFGGLLPLAFGLFHPLPSVRNYTLDFFDILSQSPTGSKFVHSLNAFHRAAYERLARERAPVVKSPQAMRRPSLATVYM